MTVYPEIHVKKSSEKYDKYEVVTDCLVQLPFGVQLLIPAGYVTDFSSVPQAMWHILPPHGRAAMPSVVHDYLYDHRMYENELGEYSARLFADFAFIHLMEQAEMKRWQRLLMYRVVRLVGRRWWVK